MITQTLKQKSSLALSVLEDDLGLVYLEYGAVRWYMGTGDPSGYLDAPSGSLFTNNPSGTLYINTDGAKTWELVNSGGAAAMSDNFGAWNPLDTGRYVLTEIGTIVHTSGIGGGLILTTDGTDNDGSQLQTYMDPYKLAVGKAAVFSATLKVSDAVESDVLLGLCIKDTTLIAAMSDGAYFLKSDDAATIVAVTEKDGTPTATATGVSMVDDTDMDFRIVWDGIDSVFFYIDDVLVATNIANLPDDEQLSPSIAFLAGDTAATVLTIKTVAASQVA